MIPFNIYIAIVAWSWQVCAPDKNKAPDQKCVAYMHRCQKSEWNKHDGRSLEFIQENCAENIDWGGLWCDFHVVKGGEFR